MTDTSGGSEASRQSPVDLVKAETPETAPRSRAITFQSMADRLTLGLLASVIGAVLVFVSAFLTWATVDSRSATGGKATSGAVTDSIGLADGRLGVETLILALASLALVAVMLMPNTKSWAWEVLIGLGALVVFFGLIELLRIPRTLRPDNFRCPAGVTCSFHRTIGPGVWFTVVTGLLVVAGAYVHHIRPVTFRPHPAGGAAHLAASEAPAVAKPEVPSAAATEDR